MCSFVPPGDSQCSRANVGGTNHCPMHLGWDRPSEAPYPNSAGFRPEFERLLHGSASFHRAEFSARTILRANFAKHANFNEVVFQDAVTIAGWRNVTAQLSGTLSLSASASGTLAGGAPPTFWQRTQALLSKARNWIAAATKRTTEKWKLARSHLQQRYRAVRRRFATSDPNTRHFEVFEGDGQLQNAIFMKPEYTVFSQVNLANVYLRGTNRRGVRFLGVTWWQPGLRRNGLRDELFVYESGSSSEADALSCASLLQHSRALWFGQQIWHECGKSICRSSDAFLVTHIHFSVRAVRTFRGAASQANWGCAATFVAADSLSKR